MFRRQMFLRCASFCVAISSWWLGTTTVVLAGATPLQPDARVETWWDASRADRINFSDHAAAECRSQNCDSLQIRSCLNDRLKPPIPPAMRDKTIAQVAAACVAGFKGRP